VITKFGTVYAGHVDLPDMGQDATPANERRFANEHLATVFDKTDAVAKVMDELGYYVIWLAEHHFQHEGYEALPNLLMSAVHGHAAEGDAGAAALVRQGGHAALQVTAVVVESSNSNNCRAAMTSVSVK
jgi:hypothetical protein